MVSLSSAWAVQSSEKSGQFSSGSHPRGAASKGAGRQPRAGGGSTEASGQGRKRAGPGGGAHPCVSLIAAFWRLKHEDRV